MESEGAHRPSLPLGDVVVAVHHSDDQERVHRRQWTDEGDSPPPGDGVSDIHSVEEAAVQIQVGVRRLHPCWPRTLLLVVCIGELLLACPIGCSRDSMSPGNRSLPTSLVTIGSPISQRRNGHDPTESKSSIGSEMIPSRKSIFSGRYRCWFTTLSHGRGRRAPVRNRWQRSACDAPRPCPWRGPTLDAEPVWCSPSWRVTAGVRDLARSAATSFTDPGVLPARVAVVPSATQPQGPRNEMLDGTRAPGHACLPQTQQDPLGICPLRCSRDASQEGLNSWAKRGRIGSVFASGDLTVAPRIDLGHRSFVRVRCPRLPFGLRR